jgi:integrase
LNDGVIHIFHAKAYCDRLIPLTENLRQICVDYANAVLEESDPCDYFFPSTDKGIYHVFTMRTAFRDYLWKCGISYLGKDKGPRLHDLRHTFAVHSLQNFIDAGKNPNEVLPVLAAYLGHKTYKGTSRYLHLTAEIYPDIVSATEKRYGSLIPESEGEHE